MAKVDKVEDKLLKTEACWSFGKEHKLDIESGTWRTARPIIDAETCNRCGICYMYCPIQCIKPDEKMENYVVNYYYCKGCGVCAKECPTKVITMKPEGDFLE